MNENKLTDDALKKIVEYSDLLEKSDNKEEHVLDEDNNSSKSPKKMGFFISLYFKIWNILLFINLTIVGLIYRHLNKVNEPYADVNWLYQHAIASGKEYHSGSHPDNKRLLKSLKMESSYSEPTNIKELEVSIDDEEQKKLNFDMECFQAKLDSMVKKDEIDVVFESEEIIPQPKAEALKEVLTKVKQADKKNKKPSKKKRLSSKK